MRAAVVRKIGGPEDVEVVEVPVPEPGPFEVRIKVAAAALNPADAAVWGGFFGPLEGVEFTGLGLDAAGTIDAVGPGVLLEVGTPVIAFDARVVRPTKAQAEYLVSDLNSIAPAPEGMDLTRAATIPLNATTAYMALDHLPLRPRGTLLVTGAAGAVGGYAVELARTRGIRTVAQGRPEDEEFLRGLGATWFVSRDDELGAAVRQLVPDGVDGVLDAAALGAPALAAARDGGIYVSVRVDTLPTPDRGVVVRHTSAGPEPTRLALLSALAEVGVLTPRVAQTFPLAEAPKPTPSSPGAAGAVASSWSPDQRDSRTAAEGPDRERTTRGHRGDQDRRAGGGRMARARGAGRVRAVAPGAVVRREARGRGVGAVVPAHISDDEEPGQEVTLTIVEVEAPHRLVWEGGSPDALLGRHTFVLTQQQDDTTEFTDSEEFYGPAAPDLVPALGQLTDRSAQYGAALRTRVEHLAD